MSSSRLESSVPAVRSQEAAKAQQLRARAGMQDLLNIMGGLKTATNVEAAVRSPAHINCNDIKCLQRSLGLCTVIGGSQAVEKVPNTFERIHQSRDPAGQALNKS